MGSAEATMSQLTKRMKNGSSWVEEGKQAVMTGLFFCMDQHESSIADSPYGSLE